MSITLNHVLMTQIDAHLRSPALNDNGLFSDIGSNVLGGQNQMNVTLDDEAGIPSNSFTVLSLVFYKPEGLMSGQPHGAYRLSWFDGENAGGTWTLDLRDDVADTNGGTLTAWSMTVCEQPPDITCPLGSTTIFSTDFEANDGGFTHSGTADEWERGLPSTAATASGVAAFTTCNSGVNCWKTDLDNTYNNNSNQDLFSPNIDLTAQTGPIVLSWAQRHQIQSAFFDHAFVEVQEVGGAGATRRVWLWLDGTMTDTVGSPDVVIGASAGWGNYIRDISDFAGKIIRVRFHLDSDATVVLAGLAIDDVSVKACLGVLPTPTPTATPGGTATPTPTATPGGTATPTPAATPTPTPVVAAQAINLSTRMLVQTGDRVGIGGFIITGSAPKHVLIRAIGPSLADFGIPNPLADPMLELHGPGSFLTIMNNNWRDTQEDAIQATGIPPTNDAEAAIDATLAPGAYTAIVKGNGANNTGVALIEVYDLNTEVSSKLGNISTRAFCGMNGDIVIAGFMLGNNTGTDRIVVRGRGPSLSALGVPTVLANPVLELRNRDGTLLVSNNDWEDNAAQAAEITAAGLAPTNALEAAIAATLSPGLYTALLAGLNNTTGIGLVEVYDRGGGP